MLSIIVYFLSAALLTWIFDARVGAIGAALIAMLLSVVRISSDIWHKRRFDWSNVWDILFVLIFLAVDLVVADSNDGTLMMGIVGSAVVAIIVGVSAFTRFNLLTASLGNFVKGFLANPYASWLMNRSLRRMTFWALLSLGVYLSAFINTGSDYAQYISDYWLWYVLVFMFATEVVVSKFLRHKYSKAEWVPLVDEEGRVIGQAPRPLVHNGSHWLHPVVHLHVFNAKGELLLQLRPSTKKIQPNKWDTAVGGHIAVNEKVEEALRREVYEEIGLQNFQARLNHRYVWRCDAEAEYVLSFVTESEGPFVTTNIGEVEELRFWTKAQLKEAVGKGILTPNLENELKKLVIL